MSKFKVVYTYPSGETDEEDDLFDSEEEAEAAGLYGVSCSSQGNEILNMSNPGDYPLVGDDPKFEVIEVEEG